MENLSYLDLTQKAENCKSIHVINFGGSSITCRCSICMHNSHSRSSIFVYEEKIGYTYQSLQKENPAKGAAVQGTMHEMKVLEIGANYIMGGINL